MANNDKAIEYNSDVLKIKKKIKDLSDVGVEATYFNNILNEIDKNIKSEAKKAYFVETAGSVQVLKEDTCANVYIDGIKKLNLLEQEISKYNVYFKTYNAALSIEQYFNKKDITSQELSEVVKLTKSILKDINDSGTRVYENESKVVEKVYSVAYGVMKLEFKHNKNSEIFNYVKNNDVAVNYFNYLIEKELESYNSTDKLNNIIKQTIKDIKSHGIEYNYLNEVLLTYLCVDDNFINDINLELKELENVISESNNRIMDYEKQIENNENDIKSIRKRCQRLKAGILALLISTSYYGTYKLGEFLGTSKTYNTTYEIYGSLDDEKRIENEYHNELTDDIKLTIYMPYEKKRSTFKREVYTYDLSDIDLEDIKEYGNLDLDSLGRKPEIEIEKKEELTLEDQYDESYYYVIKRIQDKSDLVLDKTDSVGLGTLISILLGTVLSFGIVALYEDGLNYNGKYSIIKLAINATRNIKLSKEEIKELQKILLAEKELLEKNKELKERLLSKYKMIIDSEEFNKENSLKLKK